MSELKIPDDLQARYDTLKKMDCRLVPKMFPVLKGLGNENLRYIERIAALEAERDQLRSELDAKGGQIYKLLVWRGGHDYIVMCHARNVAEARELAIEDSMGDGDWSTPVRLRMMKAVREDESRDSLSGVR